MEPGSFRFDRFALDPADRRLSRDEAPVELTGRYFDALVLLVREQGRLVTKARFHDEVWRGVPVTDEALTQCVRTLRVRLGDDAGRPRFIETVPRHGYRFIAPVAWAPREAASPDRTVGAPPAVAWTLMLRLALAGALGGGTAGVVGGLAYGLVVSQAVGAISGLLVLVGLTLLIGVLGGAGVGLGIGVAAAFAPTWRAGAPRGSAAPSRWTLVGGMAGGLLVGGVVRLLAVDAFTLLFGRSPGRVTGAAEGALLGAAVGLGVWLGARRADERDLTRAMTGAMTGAGLAGAAVGLVIPLLGGRLMGGSLDLVARQFPGSRLQLDRLGALFGEAGFGPLAQSATAALEAALFCAVTACALVIAGRRAQSPLR
jgi:DNA-binding winged helix-turn-helix (wHTH) protein